jgi:hypothetical protein
MPFDSKSGKPEHQELQLSAESISDSRPWYWIWKAALVVTTLLLAFAHLSKGRKPVSDLDRILSEAPLIGKCHTHRVSCSSLSLTFFLYRWAQ